jgi:DNA-binding ferritin-like protein
MAADVGDDRERVDDVAERGRANGEDGIHAARGQVAAACVDTRPESK